MNRLLYVTTTPSTLEGFMIPYARHFRARGWRVDGAARNVSDRPACVKEFDRVWDIEWSRNPLKGRNVLQAPRMIREIVERERYDLVHVHTPVASFVTRYALSGLRKTLNTKVIYTALGFHFYQGGNPLRNAAFLGLEKMAGRWTDCLVVVNHEDEEAVIRHSLVPASKVSYIPAVGVDFARFHPQAVSHEEISMVRSELRLSPNDHLFLMIAALIPRKRPLDAVQAVALLGRSDTHLAVAGDGPLMESMNRLSQDLKIADRVHLLDSRRDIPALIRASNATILPSSQEGLSVCVTESLGMQVPVIGTDVRGIKDLIEDGRGYVVKLGDTAGLARAMAHVLDHPEEALATARLGREYVAICDIRRILAAYEQLYTRVLSRDEMLQR